MGLHVSGSGELSKPSQELTDFSFQSGSGLGSIHHDICKENLFGKWHLIVNPPEGFHSAQAVTFSQAGDLSCAIGCDDDDMVDALVHARFKEQRDFIDGDSLRRTFGDGTRKPSLFPGHPWMDDSFQLPQFAAIVKGNRSQRAAVDGAIRTQDGLAEAFHDFPPCRLAGLYDRPSQVVGIDDDGTGLFE